MGASTSRRDFLKSAAAAAILTSLPAGAAQAQTSRQARKDRASTARGTGEAEVLMGTGTAANRTIEDIARATRGPKWFQIYLHDDRGISRELLQRAEAAGYNRDRVHRRRIRARKLR